MNWPEAFASMAPVIGFGIFCLFIYFSTRGDRD